MNKGKKFEQMFKESCEKLENSTFIRFIDSAKWVKGEKTSFTPSNKCDSFLDFNGFLFLLELKSTKGTSISYNPKKPYEKPSNPKTKVMIKHNQVKSLMKEATKRISIPGFVLNYRERKLKTKHEAEETFFVHINDFIEFAKKFDKSGLNREDCRQIGIPINSKIKKVKYEYDIKSFANAAVNTYIRKQYLNHDYIISKYQWLKEIIEGNMDMHKYIE
jgi:hypothetical protein